MGTLLLTKSLKINSLMRIRLLLKTPVRKDFSSLRATQMHLLKNMKPNRELEAKFNPIMQKVYQAAGGMPGGAGMPGGPMPDMGEPTCLLVVLQMLVSMI